MNHKMFIKKAIFGLALINSSMSISLANHEAKLQKFKLGSITFAGEGCTAQSHKIDKNGIFLINPKGFIVSTRGEQAVQRKACTFALNYTLKPSEALRISKPFVSGVSRLTDDSAAQINYELFFAGSQGQPLKLKLEGTTSRIGKNFKLSDKNQNYISECGKAGIIRGNASLAINKNTSNEISMALIKEMGLKIDTVNCN